MALKTRRIECLYTTERFPVHIKHVTISIVMHLLYFTGYMDQVHRSKWLTEEIVIRWKELTEYDTLISSKHPNVIH